MTFNQPEGVTIRAIVANAGQVNLVAEKNNVETIFGYVVADGVHLLPNQPDFGWARDGAGHVNVSFN